MSVSSWTDIDALLSFDQEIERVLARGSSRPKTRTRSIVSSRPRVAIAAALLALVIAASFTPPGRAITGEIGRWVGIGEPSTVDHSPPSNPPVSAEQHPVVIQTGLTPDGVRYEMVAFTNSTDTPAVGETTTPTQAGENKTCFDLDYPSHPRPIGTSICTVSTPAFTLSRPSFNGSRQAGPSTGIELSGLTSADVAVVRASFENGAGRRVAIPTAYGRLTDEGAASLPGSVTAGYYLVFAPKHAFPDASAPALESLRLVALDHRGDVIEVLEYGPIHREVQAASSAGECLRLEIERQQASGNLAPDIAAIQAQCGGG